ncbi:MAG: hypothetical protein AB7H88_01505 [Vicinamibacterales bacterium]
MATALKALTAKEVCALVTRLSGRPCSERKLRHLLVACALGTELPARRHGQTRLYGVLDVALLRLAVALEGEGISPWVTRVVLTYLRDDLVRAWRSASPLAVAVRGVQGTLEPVPRGRPRWAVGWVPLREIWRGLEPAVEQVAAARETVWMWKPVSARDVPRTTA